MKEAMFVWALAAGAALSLGAAENAPEYLSSPRSVQVGLWTLWHDRQVTITPEPGRGVAIRMCSSCRTVPISRPLSVVAEGGLVKFGGGAKAALLYITGAISMAAHGERLMLVYPLRVTAQNGVLVFAVDMPTEAYVERVVASESSARDGLESLKALAIVARSFALHQAHGHAEYNLCDSTHCQLLHWVWEPEQKTEAHLATLATAGETLWFHEYRAETWFHQNCGGRTASPGEVWPGRKGPLWLAGREDWYCTEGGARQWTADLSLADLSTALAIAHLATPGWTTLDVSRRGESGRAIMLRVGTREIVAEDFRLAIGRALGWNLVLSNWYEVSRRGDHFLFDGRGSGHGVGLCQAGAATMSSEGRSAEEILQHYFRGTRSADEKTGREWTLVSGESFRLETLSRSDSAYISILSRALQQAEARSGLRTAELITVRAFPTSEAFRDGTLAPGWVSAFSENNWIGTQPLRVLFGRALLEETMRHEFLHALVESTATALAPLWLREGLVEVWNGEKVGAQPGMSLKAVDAALVNPQDEAQATVAHGTAGWYAAHLLEHYGRERVVTWLRTGVPHDAMAVR